MKENAPEKIYLQPSAIEQLPYQNIVYTKPLADNSIEYTRTDALKKSWKPSDEQMEALDDAISSRDIKYDVLSELWKDLKKLKG